MRRLSARARLTLTAMLVMGVLLALVALFVDFAARRTVMALVDGELQQRAEGMARRAARSARRRGSEPPADPLRSIRPRFLETEQEAYDKPAYRLAKGGQNTYSTVIISGERVRILSSAIPSPSGEAVLQVPYPLGDIEKSQRNLRRILLTMVVPLGAVLAGLASLFLVGRLLRPLRDITERTATIEATDLGERIPVTGQDEFAALATTLNSMLDRIQRAFGQERETAERLRQFTADASHELKTPLAVIKGNSSLLLQMDTLRDDDREAVRTIDESAQRMNRLVQDLLLLARTESGPLASPIDLDLRGVLEEAIATVPDASRRVTISGESSPISGSEVELVRLFRNLVENAVRYTEGPVRLELGRRDGWATVEVADEGPGVAPEHLPHLFERFYRVDAGRSTDAGGTGLGLAIARGIVQAHQGEIDVSSQMGQGTTFTVRLPLAGHDMKTK